MDLIERQDAIDALYKMLHDCFGADDEELDAVITTINDLPPAQQWIPCSERLPESSETVLITHRGGTSFGWYNGRYWERGAGQSHRAIKTVTAWMPLPKSYGGEQDG